MNRGAVLRCRLRTVWKRKERAENILHLKEKHIYQDKQASQKDSSGQLIISLKTGTCSNPTPDDSRSGALFFNYKYHRPKGVTTMAQTATMRGSRKERPSPYHLNGPNQPALGISSGTVGLKFSYASALTSNYWGISSLVYGLPYRKAEPKPPGLNSSVVMFIRF